MSISFNPGFSILGALENKFSSLESQLLTIDNRYTQKMVQLAKKIDYLTSSSITVKLNILFFTEVFFLP